MKRIFLFLVTNLAVVLVLSVVARLLGIDQYMTARGGDLVGRDAGLDHVDRGTDPFRGRFIGIDLVLVGLAADEGAIVAGAVAVEAVHDVEEDHVTGLDHAV